MFLASYAHHQGVELYGCSIWYPLSVSGCPVHSFRENAVHSENVHNLCNGQPLTESDDTRCCINTIQNPDDEHIMLEISRVL